ncbi:MAG TPA: hypothetical protein DEE98_04170 [Elusimicrobia bacterium]|nr:MAG: hypothetical protein A2278_07180 [Elusimicrobia bacterium RIFOXYA12_FULL_49_49]OGS05981.1 MAG: hypothetical protein A2204_02875 [Elusimicrobia bacterium RIFOXYA1_FULL_47_7]OGS16180.1 MAG: hypothetical protein A2251_01005 [Elusimicrobia bacterium RIFOXYA2_FULL_47_53]OGS26621.1 MAG: hypothetical protein A2339_04355 [Elusimicrobia bacterium RIFOXYB12_FULL_50_12]OGS31334.1 MAG: hypothetical protein A2323_09295 [Elusimicrobia bacterium RIFOXYB2_FULL_46_23]HBU69563.1 hypothetical protein [El
MRKSAVIFLFAALFSACATVGRDFPVESVPSIQIGTTTQNDVINMFGSPWRTGIEDGKPTWTYGKYRYSLFSEASTTDLVIRFDSKGTVTSYSYNTTEEGK